VGEMMGICAIGTLSIPFAREPIKQHVAWNFIDFTFKHIKSHVKVGKYA
jgi:hypothetical protein